MSPTLRGISHGLEKQQRPWRVIVSSPEEQDACNEWVKTNWSLIVGLCRRKHCTNDSDAFISDVLLKLWCNWDNVQPVARIAWLNRVVSTTWIDQLRRESRPVMKKRVPLEKCLEVCDPRSGTEHQELIDGFLDYKEIILRLSPEMRLVTDLLRTGFTEVEIAKQLGKEPYQVGYIKDKIKKRISKILNSSRRIRA
jgi:RNA polymerase sigma factor (sigma-70 family)